MDTVWPLRRRGRRREPDERVGGLPAYCESLASGTGVRRRVQVVPCSFSTFLCAIVLFKL